MSAGDAAEAEAEEAVGHQEVDWTACFPMIRHWAVHRLGVHLHLAEVDYSVVSNRLLKFEVWTWEIGTVLFFLII